MRLDGSFPALSFTSAIRPETPPANRNPLLPPALRHSPTRPPPGSSQAVLATDVKWVGEPEELDRLLAEVQNLRDEYPQRPTAE